MQWEPQSTDLSYSIKYVVLDGLCYWIHSFAGGSGFGHRDWDHKVISGYGDLYRCVNILHTKVSIERHLEVTLHQHLCYPVSTCKR